MNQLQKFDQVPQDVIDKLRKNQAIELAEYEEIQVGIIERRTDQQVSFLNQYSRCMEPKLACKLANVPHTEYNKWMATDPDFIEASNICKREMFDLLASAAYQQAMGNPVVDEDGNIEINADGLVIRVNGNSTLMAKLMGLDRKDDTKGTGAVNITIDMGAVCGNEWAREHGHKTVIEHAPDPNSDEIPV